MLVKLTPGFQVPVVEKHWFSQPYNDNILAYPVQVMNSREMSFDGVSAETNVEKVVPEQN